MVCRRCKTIVKAELDKIGVHYDAVELGEVTIKEKISSEQQVKLNAALEQSGFELIDDKKNALIEKLKRAIVDLERYSDENLKTSYSDYIRLMVNDNIIYLNALFSEIEGTTIEKYIIKCKIELAKEYLISNDLTLDEIAVKMHYSNVTNLSRQFKSITGLTPSHFRQLLHLKNNNPVSN